MKQNEFEIVLLEKPGNDGLHKDEVMYLFDLMPNVSAYPFEISGSSSTAMGFITEKAADELDLMYSDDSELGQYISSILKDMELESADGTYEFKGIHIWMRRSIAQ